MVRLRYHAESVNFVFSSQQLSHSFNREPKIKITTTVPVLVSWKYVEFTDLVQEGLIVFQVNLKVEINVKFFEKLLNDD